MKIALAFSGGGYRASAFNLGTLTYLKKVCIEGESLLDQVTVLSTVSGGTITGARYATGIKKGESLSDIYASLYSFFLKADLISESIQRLKENHHWKKDRVKSLINAFADLYDSLLFENDRFGILFEDDPVIHLKHISFNATEFNTGLQFRFQVCEKMTSPKRKIPTAGLIGNFKNNIPENIARKIRMADIVAASSCFPGGFEPINFPTDFVWPSEFDDIHEFFRKENFPIGLMDGGIVDNQGIDPVLLAEERISRNNPDNKEHNLDLIIISDVSSPYMESFKSSIQQKRKGWRRLTLQKVKYLTSICFFLFAILLGYGIYSNSIILAVISTFFLTIGGLILLLFYGINRLIKKVRILDISKLKNFLYLELLVFENFFKNRIMSTLKLVGAVFMKHIRRLNYNTIYDDEYWKNRRIMNAIYELRPGEKGLEKKLKKREIPEYLTPSESIRKVSQIASDMATTLWFEKKHKENRMLDSLIACGQYTICWNLLKYMNEIRKDPANTNLRHSSFLTCEEQLKKDWSQFKENPYWLVEKYNYKKREPA